jgi:transposase
MTEIQKQQVLEMRVMGFSYKHIATTLTLLEGTVKSYCIRAAKKGLLAHPDQAQKSFCKQCQAELVQVAQRKKRIFCCKACRQKWWNSHLYLVNRTSKALYQFVCPTCGKSFSVYGNAKRTYCSHDCYIKARYYKESFDE